MNERIMTEQPFSRIYFAGVFIRLKAGLSCGYFFYKQPTILNPGFISNSKK